MVCEGCDERRKRMALMTEAARLWTAAPSGPNIKTIYLRLLNEAIVRGEINA